MQTSDGLYDKKKKSNTITVICSDGDCMLGVGLVGLEECREESWDSVVQAEYKMMCISLID
jgi:hypothetical protein